jgi:hypothetical protein
MATIFYYTKTADDRIEDYNYIELVQLLGVPASTIKGRLFEGWRSLRDVLQPLVESRLQPIKILYRA